MGLFSDIISTIGNGISDVFGGGDNNDQKKRQQQQAPQAPAPSFNNGPVKLPAVFQAAQQQQQNNPLHITNFGPAPGSNPLQPQQPQTPAEAPKIATQSYAPPAQHQSLFSHLLHGAEDVGEGAAGVGAGAALGTLRAGEGLVQGVGELPNDVTHLGTLGLNKAGVISNKTRTDVNNDVNGVTNTALSPVNWLANKTDEATGMFNHENGDPTITGKLIHDIYTPAQVAANVATIVPGATALATKAASLAGDTGKIGDVLNTIKGFTDAQSEIPNLSKVPVLGTVLDHVPGLGGKPTDDDTAGATGDKAPVESGTKAPGEPSNAPASEKNAPPEKAPNAVETGVKPPAAPPEEVGVPPEKAPVEPVAGNPGLEKTGDTGQDLQNATGLVRNVLENGRDYSGEGGNKNPLQRVLDLANSHLHSNDIISKALNSRLAAHLTSDETANVRNAIEAGSNKGLSDKEAAVFKALKQNVEAPSNTTRTNLSKDYQTAKNHFPQVRQVGVRDAAAGASKVKGVNGKLSTFNDLLNLNSRFSEGSSLGKFTRAGKTIVGDANDLGLVRKNDGTFVDKAGKVYNYSRAASQDLEKSGAKIQAPKDALTTYVRDTLNLKTKADASDYLIKNSDALGLDDTPSPGKTESVTLKGSDGEQHTFNTDEKTANNIRSSGIIDNISKQTNLGTKAWNALSSIVAQGTVVNPFAHGLNLATNAAVGAGERANGITGASTLLRSLKPIDEATELRMSDAGVHFPTYGKNVTNILSKATHGATKLNEVAVSAIDRQVRAGMFENLTKGGANDKDAAEIINKWMGGRATYNTRTQGAQLGIFWNYFGRQVKNAGRLVTQAAQGHPGALINAAIAAGGTYAADQGLKGVTGNQGAYIHAPGVVGILNDALNTGKDIASGQDRNAVTPLLSHVNPVLSTAAEQALGVNEYGDKFNNTTNTRGANILQTTPESNLFNNNGHSDAEKGLNTFGVYTPHIKGNMATSNPNLSFLNVKNAQNGSSVAFPKDFTGEQEEKAVNGLGGNYSTKSAAIMGTQTQQQQKSYVDSVNTLKKYGITDQADVENFAKLNTKDQGSYVDAVDALNKAGTAVSASSVETQLVKNGRTDLAASLNKNIPNSLSPQDKEALETYTTLGSDGQKNVWLQNNDNAANYYQATINQKNSQGALTTDDTDTGTAWSGSGNSLYTKYLVAETDKQNNVPQSTVELYKNTTKTEYDNMSGSQKDALTAYAQQLNKNGVIDKYGLATGTSGSGSSGSSSSSAYSIDKAAGIPYGTISESFVKPTSDPGLKASSPLAFKAPTLLKYAPDEKANPYTRSISVKAGVK